MLFSLLLFLTWGTLLLFLLFEIYSCSQLDSLLLCIHTINQSILFQSFVLPLESNRFITFYFLCYVTTGNFYLILSLLLYDSRKRVFIKYFCKQLLLDMRNVAVIDCCIFIEPIDQFLFTLLLLPSERDGYILY